MRGGGLWKDIIAGQTGNLSLVDKCPGLTFTEAKAALLWPLEPDIIHPLPLHSYLHLTSGRRVTRQSPKVQALSSPSEVRGIHLPTPPEAASPTLVLGTLTYSWPKLAPRPHSLRPPQTRLPGHPPLPGPLPVQSVLNGAHWNCPEAC